MKFIDGGLLKNGLERKVKIIWILIKGPYIVVFWVVIIIRCLVV